jgi:hypothetical protein
MGTTTAHSGQAAGVPCTPTPRSRGIADESTGAYGPLRAHLTRRRPYQQASPERHTKCTATCEQDIWTTVGARRHSDRTTAHKSHAARTVIASGRGRGHRCVATGRRLSALNLPAPPERHTNIRTKPSCPASARRMLAYHQQLQSGIHHGTPKRYSRSPAGARQTSRLHG